MRRPRTLVPLARAAQALIVLVAVTSVAACSSDDDPKKDGKTQDVPGGTKLGDGNPTDIRPAAQGDAFMSPFDATPDPEGKVVFFTALTREGEPGVFKVPVGGGEIVRLHVGAPLSTPFGTAISDDGKTLIVADADSERGEDLDGGALYSIPVDGGAPSAVPGSEGLYPRGLEIKEGDIFFSGRGSDRRAGLFKIALAGGAASPVAVGAPFDDPSGVAIRKNGEVYVADSNGEGFGSAIIKVVDGAAQIFQRDIAVGHPAGIALSQDENALLVSGIDADKGTDVVFRFDLGSGERKIFDAVIKDFQESAGLHRAKRAEVYAWADSRANGSGTVYVLSNP